MPPTINSVMAVRTMSSTIALASLVGAVKVAPLTNNALAEPAANVVPLNTSQEPWDSVEPWTMKAPESIGVATVSGAMVTRAATGVATVALLSMRCPEMPTASVVPLRIGDEPCPSVEPCTTNALDCIGVATRPGPQ